jgi:hypothetical protein
VETTNSKPPANHYDRPIRNTEPQWGPIYYTLFWRCTIVWHLLSVTASCTNLVQKNQFPELNWHILTFHNKFYCLESHDLVHISKFLKCSAFLLDLYLNFANSCGNITKLIPPPKRKNKISCKGVRDLAILVELQHKAYYKQACAIRSPLQKTTK